MSSLILPNRWTSQPQYPVEIDWSNPRTKNIIGTCATGQLVDAFGVLVAKSNAILVPVVSGKGILLGGFNTADFATANHPKITGATGLSAAFTLLYKYSTTYRTYLAQGGSGTAGGGWNINSANSTNNLQFTLGGVADYTLATPFVDGQIYRVLITSTGNGGTAIAYINGVAAGSRAIGTMLAASTSTIIGAVHNGGPYIAPMVAGSAIGDVVLYNRALSSDEALADYANPWQIFKAPARRIWVAGAGGLTLIPSLYVDSDTFYSPTVSPGAVTLSHSLFTDADTFYAATVTPGAITLSPDLVVDADTFYSATVMPGGVNLAPTLLSSTNTFYSPTVSTGSVNISPALFNDADTFYIPTVSLDGAPQNLTPSLYVDSDTFYSPVVSSSGSQNLLPSLFVDADIFYPFSMVNGGFAKRGEYENDQSARRTHIQESTRSNIQTSRRR